jgi:hypothetical protein
MVAIDGMLDAEAGALVLTALAAASAPRGPDDRRSAPQRRADALVEICGTSLDHGQLGNGSVVRPHLLVTAPLQALTPTAPRRPGDVTASERTDGVGEVAWTGPLVDEALRRLACDASVRRVLLDPDSLPLDVGRSTRSVPAHLREALAVRDRGCVAEGCDRPTAWTEAHHVVHWAEGGRTALDNLVLLCRMHHRKVHEGRWQFTRIGTAWRLTPPPAPWRSEVVRSDPSSHGGSDHERDPGRGGTEAELSESREQPGPDGDP